MSWLEWCYHDEANLTTLIKAIHSQSKVVADGTKPEGRGWWSKPRPRWGGVLGQGSAICLLTSYRESMIFHWPLEKAFPEQKVSTMNKSICASFVSVSRSCRFCTQMWVWSTSGGSVGRCCRGGRGSLHSQSRNSSRDLYVLKCGGEAGSVEECIHLLTEGGQSEWLLADCCLPVMWQLTMHSLVAQGWPLRAGFTNTGQIAGLSRCHTTDACRLHTIVKCSLHAGCIRAYAACIRSCADCILRSYAGGVRSYAACIRSYACCIRAYAGGRRRKILVLVVIYEYL